MSVLKKVETAATVVLTLCAVVLTSGYIRRQYFAPPPLSTRAPTPVKDWKAFQVGSMEYGATDAPLQIVAFSDYECPACRTLHRAVAAIRARDSSAVHVTYRHYPLDDLHPSARAAAHAAQCAADQQAFVRYHDALFSRQATLATVQYVALAAELRIADTARFRTCLDAPATRTVLSRDSADAAKLEIDGTPLVIVNGLMIRGAPKAAFLDSLQRIARPATALR